RDEDVLTLADTALQLDAIAVRMTRGQHRLYFFQVCRRLLRCDAEPLDVRIQQLRDRAEIPRDERPIAVQDRVHALPTAHESQRTAWTLKHTTQWPCARPRRVRAPTTRGRPTRPRRARPLPRARTGRSGFLRRRSEPRLSKT